MIPYNPPATSAIEHHSIIVQIEQHYTFIERGVVMRFLEAHPDLPPALLDVAALIPTHFSGAILFLRIVDTAPTRDAPDGHRLVVFIATDLAGEQAMAQLDRLMTAWRPDVRSRSNEPLSVDLASGTTADAVEAAARRFIQTHGPIIPTECGELARRLLESPPDSTEAGSARAELAISLADDQGRSRPVGGGDALAVLARLRRQAGTSS